MNSSFMTPVSRLEAPPAFVNSNGDLPSSLASISMVLGEQKPDWHLPIPALVLRFTASSDFAHKGLRIAFKISPSVTVSQRQITFP